MIIPKFVYKGSEQSPFLAPRGIFVHQNIMAVCDTAQNRVYIWTSLPKTEFQEPDIILGTQKDVVSASTFYYPSGLWFDGKKLIVADAWNHRVLIWNTFPTHSFTPADVVLGQADFIQNKPNVDGVNSPASSQKLHWCYGVFSNGKSLWIADTGNRRVLYFEFIPVENFTKADAVIGQTNFETKDYVSEFPTWPYSVKISEKGEMLISDTQCFRVHYWKKWEEAIHQKADFLIGQQDFVKNGQNQFSLKPKAQTLSWCYDAIFDNVENTIYVADTGNSRILKYNETPKQNNIFADEIYGQRGFEEVGDNIESVMGHDDFMYWPFSITTNSDYLIVCETGNNRIFFYEKQ